MLKENTSKEIKLAWAAGLFEGEGSISFRENQSRKHPSVRISIASSDFDVIDEFQKIFNYGRMYVIDMGEKRKSMKHLHITKHNEVKEVLLLLYPYLGKRRSQKAHEAWLLLHFWEMEWALKSPRADRQELIKP